MMGFIRTSLTVLFLCVVAPLAALVVFPWTFITGRVGLLYFSGMGLARLAVSLAGVRVKLMGLEKIDPAGTYIFMSNHVSNLDPPILAPRIPRRTSILAKKELWRIPVLARAFDQAEIVPVERSNREAAILSMKQAHEVMRSGINMMIYPEGTRSADGCLLPFKKGPFHLAMDTGFPILPVTILGTFELMPKGSLFTKSGTATLVFHSPVYPGQYSSREELMQAVRDAINIALPPGRQ